MTNDGKNHKIKILGIGTCGCTACIVQTQLLARAYEFEKFYFEGDKAKARAKEKYNVTQDDIPTFILLYDGQEIYRTLVPITLERIKMELDKITGKAL